MALVLSRDIGEQLRLLLPDGREVTVCCVATSSRGRVRLAVCAPEDVIVERPEADRWTLDGEAWLPPGAVTRTGPPFPTRSDPDPPRRVPGATPPAPGDEGGRGRSRPP